MAIFVTKQIVGVSHMVWLFLLSVIGVLAHLRLDLLHNVDKWVRAVFDFGPGCDRTDTSLTILGEIDKMKTAGTIYYV